MKSLMLVLLFLIGCSTTNKFYNSPEVAEELEKNGEQLKTISTFIEKDYSSKEAFFAYYSRQSGEKNPFVLQNLKDRLFVLKTKKDAILAQASYIKTVNDDLLTKVAATEKIEQKDPLFEEIESFTKVSQNDARNLFTDVDGYRKSSEDFIKFTIFTRNDVLKAERRRN